MDNITPAPYSNTDTAEILAVNKFSHLLNPNIVKLDIKDRDKFPNVDGYVELVNSSRIPIGKLEVQIKKLPEDFNPDDPKIRIEKSLLAYSKTGTANPVLFIGVDVHNSSAYWIHIHGELININGKQLSSFPGISTLIPLNLDNSDNGIITIDDENYVGPWQSISRKRIESVNDHKKLKKLLHELEKHSEPTLGEYSPDFGRIHIFLDELNEKLGYFDIIKHKLYFTDTWKLGLAYDVFTNTQLGYTLYPIPFNKNDVQIKKIIINKDSSTELRQFGNRIMHHFKENPIKNDPKNYVKELISEDIKNILNNRLLRPCNEFIAKEIVFAVMDNSYGLNQDSYELKEIEYIINNNEIVNKYKKYDFFNQISFRDAMIFLDSKGITEINRDYLPRNFERNSEESWIWNTLSYDSARDNLEKLFINLPNVYNDILSCNFPKISNKLPLFSGSSRVLVSYLLKDVYHDLVDHPRLNFIYLKSDDPNEFEIKLYDMEEQPFQLQEILRSDDRTINIDGKSYQISRVVQTMLNFIYGDTPMLSFIYPELEANFKVLFANWSELFNK